MTDSCSNEATQLISINLALQTIKQSITPINSSERVALKHALGRILSHSISSQINIPPEKNSAMDGYAFSSAEIKPDQSFLLTLVGTSCAGSPFEGKLNKGECIRIFTGAIVPNGADSVIMQEHIENNDTTIIFPSTTKAKQNIRDAGCDIKKNATLLSSPKELSAMDIGLLASAGIYDIPVKTKLTIAFFSTGDELCAIGTPLKQGQIYDSNRYTLSGLLKNPNYIIDDLGRIADDKNILEKTLQTAAKSHDVIISTGGASVGDADYIKEILDKCGDVVFWKIAIKPGKPLAFGKINHCHFFGLPGNPVSVIATFHKIVAPALQHLSGIPAKKTIQIRAVCTSDLKKQKGRQEYQRGILSQDETGNFFVKSAGKQGSNIMTSMSKANCYIVLPINSEGVVTGQVVIVEPFESSI
jgi:molybdopterin molybdotransferase